MIRPTVKIVWQDRYERDREAYPQLLEMDPFEAWDQNRMPERTVERQMELALALKYADGPDKQAREFLSRAIAAAERAIREGKLTSPECESRFPHNRGVLLRAATYAEALQGKRLDLQALEQASRDLEEWWRDCEKEEWDSQAQANYLAAIRLGLIAGDLDRARDLLKTRKSFKWHAEEHELWKYLAEYGGRVRDDPGFAERLQRYFDRIRDPRFDPDVYMDLDVLRLELAAIRDKYIVSEDRQIDWTRAVNSVAA